MIRWTLRPLLGESLLLTNVFFHYYDTPFLTTFFLKNGNYWNLTTYYPKTKMSNLAIQWFENDEFSLKKKEINAMISLFEFFVATLLINK
jgi:hypothetical protein